MSGQLATAEAIAQDAARLRTKLVAVRQDILKPVEHLDLDDWADRYRYLSPEASSEPGKWETSRVEVARGPMKAVSDPQVRIVTVMGPTQLLKTEMINNSIGYIIDQDPGPTLMVQPTEALAEAWGNERFDKMVRDTPRLTEKISKKKSRDSANSKLHKEFTGGYLAIVGANAPGGLASRPIRNLLLDEIDKYPLSAGREGDPIKLARERTATFWNRKIIQVCSPTVEGKSRIAQEYEASDQRVYEVPCPSCGHAEEMQWRNVVWPEGEPEKALYHCPECRHPWEEYQRLEAIQGGEWRATKPFKGHAGFRCSKLVSPWETIAELAMKFCEAKKNVEQLKVFVNTSLAETWKEKGDAPEWKKLYDRREIYPKRIVPKPAVFLTAGVDVQKDRLEVEIKAWARGQESWSIDYRVLMGETEERPVWELLDGVLGEQFEHENGRSLHIAMMAVDSGYLTQTVYNWVRGWPATRVVAIKGRDNQSVVVGTPSPVDVNINGQKIKRGTMVWPIGVSILKAELYRRLKLERPIDGEDYPPGYLHYPEYSEDFFKQLTAEQLVSKISKGYRVYEWQKVRERNEALDTAIYCRAAAAILGMDRMKPQHWDKLESEVGVHSKSKHSQGPNPGAPPPAKKKKQKPKIINY